jgi:hypothetical protein
MPITAWQDNPRVYTGEIVLEDVEDAAEINVGALINAEITDFIPSSYESPASACVWGVSTRIQSYDTSAVKKISGYPLRAMFGSITYFSIGENKEVQWINYELQYFKMDRCIVLPYGYLGASFNIADIPATVQVGAFSTASGYVSTLGFYGLWDGITGATGFKYDLESTVIADINITYMGRINDEVLPGPISIIDFRNL